MDMSAVRWLADAGCYQLEVALNYIWLMASVGAIFGLLAIAAYIAEWCEEHFPEDRERDRRRHY
jgi:hypothetical protein